MSQACKSCQAQIHSVYWHNHSCALKGVWSGSVQMWTANCSHCGHTTYYATVNRCKQMVWTDGVMDFTRFNTYKRPAEPINRMTFWYIVHPLAVSSDFHRGVVKWLSEMVNPELQFIITEERFHLDLTRFGGSVEISDKMANEREGPYPNAHLEWMASLTVLNRFGKPELKTIWPSYFRPGLVYNPLFEDQDMFKMWNYGFRTGLPIEIKVKS